MTAQGLAVRLPDGTIPTICACCGVLFHPRNVHAAYCGGNCRRRARYYRAKGQPVPVNRPGWTRPIRPAVIQPEILPPAPAALEVRQWNGTPIERRPDGYVNATAMCQANGKRWHDFRSTAQCNAYMQALASEAGISGFDLVVSQRGGTGAGGSTWIHPDLATELARWISPAFSVFVNRWFRSTVEAGQAPALPTTTHHLPEGVHVIAATRRRAAELWWQAIESEVHGALSRRLNPRHRTDAGLPLVVGYQWQQLSLIGR
jgi:hypothetical protein